MSGANHARIEKERRRFEARKRAREEQQRAALDAGEAHTLAEPGSNPGPATAEPVAPTGQPGSDGPRIYTGDAASVSRDRRDWYDYGKDTGRRLRVKGVVDADSLPVVRPEPPPNVDPGQVDEIHRQSQEAMAEGDDRKLSKIYEDLLDTLHSKDIPTTDEDPIQKVRLDLRAKDLDQALGSELAELGRGKNWAVGYKLEESGAGEVVLVVGVKDKASGIPWLVTVDQRALYAAARRAGADVRNAAREIATHVRDVVDQARAGATVGAN